MAATCTHSVFLRSLLIIFVLLDVTRGTASPTKKHFRRKDFPENEKLNNMEARNKTKYRSETKKFPAQPVRTAPADTFSNVTYQTRTTVILECDKRKLDPKGIENTTVIWVRLYNDGFTILTDGNNTVTDDKRFMTTNITDPEIWSLHIRYAKLEDQGRYRCLLCAQGNPERNIYFNRSIYFDLHLVEASAEIIGESVRIVDKVGSPLRLSCKLNNIIVTPKYIYWYRDGRVINFDLDDGATVREGRQGSELIFPRAEKDHAGNYTCAPSNAKEARVRVIINAKTSGTVDAKKNIGSKTSHPQSLVINMLLLVCAFPHYR